MQGFADYEIPFYKVGSLKYSDSDGWLYDETNTINEEIRKNLKAVLIPKNAIVFAKIGEAIRLNRRALTPKPCCIDNNLMSFTAEKCGCRFAYFWSLTLELYKYANATTVPAIRKTDLEAIPFPLPPLAEQERIVALVERLFARLDEAAEIVRETLDASEERRSALLRSAFSGALTAQWREKHGVGIETWRQTKLKAVCQVNPPKMKTQHLPDDLEASFFPMASLSEIEGAITEPQTRPLKEVRKGFTNFQEGDVVFAKITPCMENGKSAVVGPLVNGIGYGTTEFYVLRCSSALLNRYVYHLVRSQSFRDEAKAVMTGAVGQQRVPKSFLEEYPLNLPSVAEQAEIVRLLDAAFEKERRVCELAEETAARIETLKKAILARAFRGELGTNDPTDPKPFAPAPTT